MKGGVYRILTQEQRYDSTEKGMVSYPASTMTAQTGNRFTLVWGHIYSKVK